MPNRPIQYANSLLDRVADRRSDRVWLNEALAASATRVVVVADRKHPISRRDGHPAPVYLQTAPVRALVDADDLVLLGIADRRAYFACFLSSASAKALLPDDAELLGLRDVVADLDGLDAAILALAGGLLAWHRSHGYCPACGGATAPRSAGHVRRCVEEACGRQHFPRTDPAVIMLAIHGHRCLLARRRIWPVHRRSTIAGFVEPGETLEQSVAREMVEEVGIQVGAVRYRGSQPWPFPASLMVGFWAEATSTEITVDGDEIAEADWYTRERIHAGVSAGTLTLPPPDSISARLVADWLDADGDDFSARA